MDCTFEFVLLRVLFKAQPNRNGFRLNFLMKEQLNFDIM